MDRFILLLLRNPKTGKSKDLLPVMSGQDHEKAGAGKTRVLMANMSFGVMQGYSRCLLFDGCKLIQTSWLEWFGRDERFLDLFVCLSREFNCLEKPAAVRKLFTDFQNAAWLTAQSFGL